MTIKITVELEGTLTEEQLNRLTTKLTSTAGQWMIEERAKNAVNKRTTHGL